MATTRSFSSLGVFATNADTVIPVTPIPGTAYRDTTTSEANNELGEQYNTEANSATFNQKLFIISSFTDIMDSHGMVGWSDLVDYTLPAWTWGSDNNFYFALQASGPSGVGAQDPVSTVGYWQVFTNGQTAIDQLDAFELALSNEVASSEGATLVGTTGQTVQEKLDALTLFGCKASARIDINANILYSNNISTASNPSNGRYEFTLTNARPNADYVVLGMHITDTAALKSIVLDSTTMTTSFFAVYSFDDNGGHSLIDGALCLAVF